jgi:hypothetical protein
MLTAILAGAPFDENQTAAIKRDFFRDGFRLVPEVLSAPEVASLRDAVDELFADEKWKASDNVYNPIIAARLFETNPIFQDMLTREPLISLAENILGEDCHLIAQNIVRNPPGQAIDTFHMDDPVMFPIAPGMERHDPRLQMPVNILTYQIPLTDIPSLEYGPTEYVPGSHYAGREPDDPKNPSFEGRGAVPVLCSAGDVYLHNSQCWHRGMPNTSDRTRYLFQVGYARRWVSQRLFPFVNYQIPAHVLDRADERRKRVLGIHPKGNYG